MGYSDGTARRAGIGRIPTEQFSEGPRCLCEPLVAEPGESGGKRDAVKGSCIVKVIWSSPDMERRAF